MAQSTNSATRTYAFRLKPGDDLKNKIDSFVQLNHIKAGAIVTCVGSLTKVGIRLANQNEGKIMNGFFEIVSLTGVLSTNGSHLHIAVSDEKGRTTGGHLLQECIIYTTAEIVITQLTDLEFHREIDKTYGYKELVVKSTSAQ